MTSETLREPRLTREQSVVVESRPQPGVAIGANIRSKVRRRDLDCAKGLGILLVVFGHIVARDPPTGNEWYTLLKDGVYQFHMPYFMYLSGYVTFLSGAARVTPAAWPLMVSKRAFRLLLPFVIFGIAIVIGKMIAAHFMYVDNLPDSITGALRGLLWNTDFSPATSVWYIGVLFVFCALAPPLIWLGRGRIQLLLGLAAAVYFLPVPHVLYLNLISKFAIFFALGGLAAEAGERWLGWIDRATGWMILALLTALTCTLAFPQTLPFPVTYLLCGVLSIPALHGLVRKPMLSSSQLLLRVGSFSAVIYLLNTPCIGLVKGLTLRLLPWDGYHFLLFAPLLMAAGTIGPIVIKRFALRHVPVFDRMTD
jgi:fucose 4-O-acetylase-like acetyltransferase